MKQNAILLCIAAIIFGIASPFFASAFAKARSKRGFTCCPRRSINGSGPRETC
jgi:hypothetical protein